MGKVESLFVEFLTLIGDSEPRCVAGTEGLPEHHKPPQGHHFVLRRIWCCLCSKPAQGFPGVTRAGYTNPGADPHCTQWGEQELEPACEKIITKKKKPKPQNQQPQKTSWTPLATLMIHQFYFNWPTNQLLIGDSADTRQSLLRAFCRSWVLNMNLFTLDFVSK